MNKNFLVGGMTFLMICFLILGCVLFMSSKNYEGSMVHTGYYSGDTFVSTHSGSVGGNHSKMKQLKTFGTGCFILSSLCGVTAIVVKISDKN